VTGTIHSARSGIGIGGAMIVRNASFAAGVTRSAGSMLRRYSRSSLIERGAVAAGSPSSSATRAISTT